MQVKDMTKGNELKLIILFSLPLMLGNIFQQLYTVCDTIIVSRHSVVRQLQNRKYSKCRLCSVFFMSNYLFILLYGCCTAL